MSRFWMIGLALLLAMCAACGKTETASAPEGGVATSQGAAKAMGAMGYRASHDVFVKGCRWAVN